MKTGEQRLIKENSSPTVKYNELVVYVLVAVHIGDVIRDDDEIRASMHMDPPGMHRVVVKLSHFTGPYSLFTAFCYFYDIYNCNCTQFTHFCISFHQSAQQLLRKCLISHNHVLKTAQPLKEHQRGA